MARPKAADFVVSKNFQCKNFQSKTISCSFEPKEQLRLRKKLGRKRVFGQFEIFHLTSEEVFDIFCIWIQILHQSVSNSYLFMCWLVVTYILMWMAQAGPDVSPIQFCRRVRASSRVNTSKLPYLGWALAGYQGYPRVRASYPRVSGTERAREKTKSADGKGIKGNIGSGFKVQGGPEREMILCHNKFPLLQY